MVDPTRIKNEIVITANEYISSHMHLLQFSSVFPNLEFEITAVRLLDQKRTMIFFYQLLNCESDEVAINSMIQRDLRRIKNRLANRIFALLHLKQAPKITFEIDDHQIECDKIDQVMKSNI